MGGLAWFTTSESEGLTRWELTVPDQGVSTDQLSVLLCPVDQEVGITHSERITDVW